MRAACYEAKTTGALPNLIGQIQQQHRDATNKMSQLYECTNQTIGMMATLYNSEELGASTGLAASSTNPFAIGAGGSTSSNIFGAAPATSNPFGAGGNVFGTVTAASNVFGGGAGGVSTIAPGGGSIFGGSSSIFGGGSATGSSSVFGGTSLAGTSSATSGGSIFGLSSAAATSSPFSLGQQQHQDQSQTANIFGQTSTAPSANGGGSVFGGTATFSQPNGGIFGGTTTSAFGQSSGGGSFFGGSNVFGGGNQQSSVAAAQNPFGGAAAATQSNFGESVAPPSGLFASVPVPTNGNIFGAVAPQQQQNIFGQPTAAVTATTAAQPPINPFAAAAQQPQQFGAVSTGTFGSTSAGAATNYQSPFGAVPQPKQDAFATQSNINPFQQQNQQQGPIDNTIYTPIESISEQDLAWFKMDHFELGQIPTVPPSRELCA